MTWTNQSSFGSERNMILRTRALVPIALLLTMPGLGLLQAQHVSYSFTRLATLGEKATLIPPPSGPAFHINDFEPGAINNHGDVVYGTDLGTNSDPATWSSTNFGEGVFLRRAGQVSELDLGHSTGNAPGGGMFDVLLQGQSALNDEGDAAFAFALSPFGDPVKLVDFYLGFINSGVYRYSHTTGSVSAIVVPFVTPSPAGGTFPGVGFNTSLNSLGDLVFAGIVGDKLGIFKADTQGSIASVVRPGDLMPGNTTFETGGNSGPWINKGGDVAFTAQLAGEIVGRSSIYVKQAGTGKIIPIAHGGDPAPGGGTFRGAFSPVLNDFGDVAFQGDLSPGNPTGAFEQLGVYLYSNGATTAVARPGDVMPGGGHFVTASFFVADEVHVNNGREVVFSALLDTDNDNDGNPDTGLFVWWNGSVQVVARTGIVIPGIGTVRHLATATIGFPQPPVLTPSSGALNNDSGQLLFGATLTDGTSVLLVATPAKCDVDGNGVIDIADIQAIVNALGTTVGPSDSRDADSNGVINVLDSRACVLKCTKANCAR